MSENVTVETDLDGKLCNCDDEFKTETCPVHFKGTVKKYDNRVVITDNQLVPEEIKQWVGYSYFCPECGEPAIMDMMHYCGNCGVGLILKSRKLTDFINELSNRNMSQKNQGS